MAGFALVPLACGGEAWRASMHGAAASPDSGGSAC
jgi:hypothetical protein